MRKKTCHANSKHEKSTAVNNNIKQSRLHNKKYNQRWLSIWYSGQFIKKEKKPTVIVEDLTAFSVIEYQKVTENWNSATNQLEQMDIYRTFTLTTPRIYLLLPYNEQLPKLHCWSTQEAEAGVMLWAWGKPGLHSECKTIVHCTARSCLQNKTKLYIASTKINPNKFKEIRTMQKLFCLTTIELDWK